jgi:hypothetical protein
MSINYQQKLKERLQEFAIARDKHKKETMRTIMNRACNLVIFGIFFFVIIRLLSILIDTKTTCFILIYLSEFTESGNIHLNIQLPQSFNLQSISI